MSHKHSLWTARKRISRALHLDALKDLSGFAMTSTETTSEWVIVYRTARGFCCMHHDAPVEFREMLDVQIWAEEMDVQTYFIGL